MIRPTVCWSPGAILVLLMTPAFADAQAKPRARDLGVPFEGTPGKLNAITDVPGIEVGHSTIISGAGKLQVGVGPIRTGVTAIFPRGRELPDPVFGAWFSLNGAGEVTGTTWLEESGFLEGPVMITNTHSVGVVRDAVCAWWVKRGIQQQPWVLPVVGETWDGHLNDANGFHVKEKHVLEAIQSAKGGAVAEGNVGGGTGMTCFEFKGGIGSASRKLTKEQGDYTLGILVQANFGLRKQLKIAGVPVGQEITEAAFRTAAPLVPGGRGVGGQGEAGSIIVVLATDAPLLPHQLKRLARRVSLGLARVGSVAGNGSGDIFIAFSTANPNAAKKADTASLTMLPNERMNALFEATAEATEEAIVNALVAAETMTGRDDNKVIGLPHERLKEVLKKYNRLAQPKKD